MFIERLEIVDWVEGDKHVEYIVSVRGRTKYLVDLAALAENGLIDASQMGQVETEDGTLQVAEYCITKRYSELLLFNKLLQAEMKNYMKKKGFEAEEFPAFPPKKLFNKGKGFIQKRVQQINAYFAALFRVFPQKVPFTNAVVDLCQPFKLNLALIGQRGSGKSAVIEGLVRLLVDFQQNKDRFFGLTSASSDADLASTQDQPTGQPVLGKSKSVAASQQLTAEVTSNQSWRGRDQRQRGQSKEQQRVAKLVFKKRERERSHDQDLASLASVKGATNQRRVDQCFPLDVLFRAAGRHLLIRLDVQEYQVEEADLRSLLTYVLQSEEKNALLFTFDVTSASSFKLYLKKALKDLIFAFEDLNDGAKERKMIPFMVLGTKKDLKARVSAEDVAKLIDVLKKHVRCDVQYVARASLADTLASLRGVLGLAEELFLQRTKA